MDYDKEYDLSEMSDEEKHKLIFDLASELNKYRTLAAEYHDGFIHFAHYLADGNVLGKRRETMDNASLGMMLTATMSTCLFDLDDKDLEQIQVDVTFDDIVDRFEDE